MEHPITPPPPPYDLVKLWLSQWVGADTTLASYIATRASQWGWVQRGAATEAELQQRADQELEACCEWTQSYAECGDSLRAALATSPPEPPSEKEIEQFVESIRMPWILKQISRATDPDPDFDTTLASYIATRASQWGWVQRGAATEAELQQRADQELEACCEWTQSYAECGDSLRAARRPMPPSKAESALNALEHILRHSQTDHGANTIRLALERLKKLEALPND